MKNLLLWLGLLLALPPSPSFADNSIFALTIYKHNGLWVFDDADRGLVKEPFVGKITDIFNHLSKDIAKADDGVRLLFATGPFPGHADRITWKTQGEAGYGDFYTSRQFKEEIWLCPALLKYFPRAPEVLYYRIEPLRP